MMGHFRLQSRLLHMYNAHMLQCTFTMRLMSGGIEKGFKIYLFV